MTESPGPLVSVVVPCFDTDPGQLDEAIGSATSQTYPHVEVVVVDDGSSRPETLDHLRRLEHPAVRVLHQANRGVSAARNHGMSQARGDFLLPLDGDDVLDPGHLAATVPVLCDDERVAIVSTQAEYFGERQGRMALVDPTLPWMVAENSIHNSSLFRRSAFERLGGYDEALTRGFEDHEWWLRILLDGGRAIILDEVLFRYRIQPRSRNATASSDDTALHELRRAIVRNNPAHADELLAMAFDTLDSSLARMHRAEARVAHLEHHLGPAVRLLDRHPSIRQRLEAARKLKSRLR